MAHSCDYEGNSKTKQTGFWDMQTERQTQRYEIECKIRALSAYTYMTTSGDRGLMRIDIG